MMNPSTDFPVLEKRREHVSLSEEKSIRCDVPSIAGSMSQRACTFCGSRVVLYPISDALHLVHGPVGCAAYTWDIRGSLSSGPELHRMSFCTDLREQDIIRGGTGRLAKALAELIPQYQPKAAFVYATCIAGLIGDDIERTCREAEAEFGIPVIPVQSEGFRGTKKDGYNAACAALETLVGQDNSEEKLPGPYSINLLGEFNIAGEGWAMRKLFEEMGVEVVASLTGDGRVDDIRRAHRARLNILQCSGSMTALAKKMEKEYGIPYLRVSFFGLEDTAQSLYDTARHFGDPEMLKRTRQLVAREVARVNPELEAIRKRLDGHKACIYVGGAFKAISLIQALRRLGIRTVVVGSQTGSSDDYQQIRALCDPGTVIVDDSNPRELSHFARVTQATLFIGGVKERPMAFKLGMAFCDHNHERKSSLVGFDGMLNFAHEVESSLLSPVWKFVDRRRML
ncbi:MAG TPA: nitrogenase iron-molybdenum cofactor biosynthesis protein NifE [Fibrobacteraceae bacterium]|nr:nitrogenase iron-molybdenum cofactor biosynthesis protein NifE [Fibrobacteraceae bacterium]